eukprot:4313554-Pyramimonas_sp.AAC.1
MTSNFGWARRGVDECDAESMRRGREGSNTSTTQNRKAESQRKTAQTIARAVATREITINGTRAPVALANDGNRGRLRA